MPPRLPNHLRKFEWQRAPDRTGRGKQIYVETSSTPIYEPTRVFYDANGLKLAARLPDYHWARDDLWPYRKTIE